MSYPHVPAYRTRSLALAATLLLPISTTVAQDTIPKTSKSDAVTLDTVEVTAQRRTEDIQDVPVSISIVNPEQLNVLGSGGKDVRFLTGRVPSLNIESSFGRAFPRFYIRGLGNSDFDVNGSQPVSLVYDDVVQENALLKGFPVFDLDHVEVLRGPQGTLFGRNSPAGVVKFESVKPSQQFNGYVRLGYGSDNMWNFESAVGGALSKRWSARISTLYQRRDDQVENTFPGPSDAFEGYDEAAARVQFLYEGDAFEGLFNLHKRNLNSAVQLFRANIIKFGSNDLVDGFDRDKVAQDGINFSDLESWGGSARLRWSLGDYRLYSITGYETLDSFNVGDIDGGFGASFLGPGNFGPGNIPFPVQDGEGIPDHSQFTQEFRIESDLGGRFNWQGGLFWFDEDVTVVSVNYDPLSGNVPAGRVVQQQENTAWALFVSGEYAVTDRFKLRAGTRYTQDKRDYSASVVQAVPFGSPVSGPFVRHIDVDNVSWDASGVFAVNDDVNLYARVATGFRAPSIRGRLFFESDVSTADSENVISYEAGIKADLWNRRASLGFNIFRYEVKDQQIVAVGGGGDNVVLLNADRTNGQGFELDLQAYLTDHLLVTLGSSYNDTEIRDRDLQLPVCGAVFFMPPICTPTDPISVNAIGSTVADIDGNPLPQAPKWIHSLTARYGLPVGDGGEFFVYTDWAYRSSVNFQLYEAKEFRGKPLLEGGLRVGYSWHYGEYEVAAFGRNITDTIRVLNGVDFNNLTGAINEPRTLGIEFMARF